MLQGRDASEGAKGEALAENPTLHLRKFAELTVIVALRLVQMPLGHRDRQFTSPRFDFCGRKGHLSST